jgi:KipI family sensor histidine kinase inhibitor
MTVPVLPYGDRALLLELAQGDDVLAVRDAVAALGVAGIGGLVPAARTLLVQFDPAVVNADRLRALLANLPSRPRSGTTPEPLVTLPVAYDGADLAEVARIVRASVHDVIAWHSAPIYTVAFCGFSPGFGYLRGLDERLHVPRLASPRTRVPAGSVAIAAEYTGIYPRPSPGGWRLLGRTDAPLWDVDGTPPALLAPGTRVRFEPR